MLRIYKTMDEKGLFKEIDKIEKGCWINLVDPSTQEINNIINAVKVNEDFVKYALDIEERARIDVEDNQTLIIIDTPIVESKRKEIRSDFATIPLGIIVVNDDYFITICT